MMLLLSVVQLLNDLENPQRLFIDQFQPVCPFVGQFLIQLKETLVVAADTDALRQHNIFNPMYDGDAMVLPAEKQVLCGFECDCTRPAFSLD